VQRCSPPCGRSAIVIASSPTKRTDWLAHQLPCRASQGWHSGDGGVVLRRPCTGGRAFNRQVRKVTAKYAKYFFASFAPTSRTLRLRASKQQLSTPQHVFRAPCVPHHIPRHRHPL